MKLSDTSSHLNSDEHKQRTEEQYIWCGDCETYISDKKYFQV